jgi:hypothetical protein
MKLLRVTCCLFIFLLSLVAFAFVSAHPARADGLNPPPRPGSTCQTTGSGTICRITLDTTFSNLSVFKCGSGADSFDVDENGTTHRSYIYFYDQDGNLTERILHVFPLAGTFSNAVTGKSVPESAQFTITVTLLTPGDFSTAQYAFTGLYAKVILPGGGIILLDAGAIVYDPDGNISLEGGKHQYIDSQVDQLCAALS